MKSLCKNTHCRHTCSYIAFFISFDKNNMMQFYFLYFVFKKNRKLIQIDDKCFFLWSDMNKNNIYKNFIGLFLLLNSMLILTTDLNFIQIHMS